MQLLHEHNILTFRDLNNGGVKDAGSNVDVKDKLSSNGSLLVMNPVASGDNVAMDLASAHKLKEPVPPLVPCCEGKELLINEDLVRSGLSAISVKHDSVIQCLSMSRACEKLQVAPGLVKHRNSFRCLHRPDLKRVPYLRRLSPDELESLFRGYADFPPRAHSGILAENRDERSTPPEDNVIDLQDRDGVSQEGTTPLNPIPETRSGAEDVPAGMRLHGARARLYTSVLAGAKAGDQLDAMSTAEEYEAHTNDDTIPDDEVQISEELQIILPPRCDDVMAESTITASGSNS